MKGEKADFFALRSGFILQEQPAKRLETYYNFDDIARFSILFGGEKLSEEQKTWRGEAKRTGKKKFYRVITQAVLDNDSMDGDMPVSLRERQQNLFLP